MANRTRIAAVNPFTGASPAAQASPLATPHMAMDRVPGVVWTTDRDLRIVTIGGTGLVAMMTRPVDCIGRHVTDVFPADGYEPGPGDLHHRALAGESSTFDLECRGRLLLARVEALRSSTGDILGTAGIALDSTDRRVGERAVRLSERSYRSLIEEMPYGICRATVTDRLLQVNRAMADMLGYESEADLLSRNIATEIFVEADAYRKFLEKLQENRSHQGFECSWHRRDRTSIHVSLGGRMVRDESGAVLYLDILAESVSERKQLEEQLRQVQKMQAIGQLAGGIAHDFNNLLTVVKGQVEIVLRRMSPVDPLRHRLQEIERAADRASTLTGQLLAFSRRQILQTKVVDLNVVIEGMTQMLAHLIGENIELTFAKGAGTGRVRVDPGQMEQVLMNLVVNARDAMPSGGRLSIATARAYLDAARAQDGVAIAPGDYVELVVNDNGRGMDAETRRRIFEPFFTTKKPGQGTGLGLSMVYGVVKQSGGYIFADSSPGTGATFRIYLPSVADPADERKVVAATTTPAGHETILLAEDEESVRDLIAGFLIELGYTVVPAANGETARQLALTYVGTIDLLVTDLVMPKGGGRELAKELRKTIPALKVLYISGYAGDSVARRAVTESGTSFVPKPLSMQFLAKRVREVLDAPPVGKGR